MNVVINSTPNNNNNFQINRATIQLKPKNKKGNALYKIWNKQLKQSDMESYSENQKWDFIVANLNRGDNLRTRCGPIRYFNHLVKQ